MDNVTPITIFFPGWGDKLAVGSITPVKDRKRDVVLATRQIELGFLDGILKDVKARLAVECVDGSNICELLVPPIDDYHSSKNLRIAWS
jgi:hypothetical protein